MHNYLINGKLISLRSCISSDFEKIYQWLFYSNIPYFRDLIKVEHMGVIPTIEEFQLDYPSFFFDGSAPEKGRGFIIINSLKEEVGHISYTSFHLLPGISELDIWLSGNKYTCKGYGPIAIKLLTDHLFDLDYRTMIMRPSKMNVHAISAYKKAGLHEIVPIYRNFYKKEFIDLYRHGDWGKDNDLFMVVNKPEMKAVI